MKRIMLVLFNALTLTACIADRGGSRVAADVVHQHSHPAANQVPPAVHGMVLFGKDQLYASHVPMFMAPHDWQALFKVTLSHPKVDVMALYQKVRSQTTAGAQVQTLLTLQPKPFILPPLLEGKSHTFEAALYLGNFEDGGKVLLQGITVKVEKVLTVQHLDPRNQPLAALNYYLLKDGKNSYLVHKISAPDNFDQIVEVKWLKKEPQQQDGLKILVFTADDTLQSKLQSGQTYELTPEGKLLLTTENSTADLQVLSAFYCTVGPDFFKVCE